MKTVAAVLLLLLGQGAASAQSCLPRAQAGRMAVALVPSLIDAAARHCRAHLPAGAFLGNGSSALAERIGRETAPMRSAAAAAVLDLTGQAVPAPGQDTGPMIDTLAANLAASLDAPKCRAASELLEALAPLPTANIGQAFAAVLGAAATEAGEDAPAICAE